MPDTVFYTASTLGDHSLIWLIFATLRGLRGEHQVRAAARAAAAIGAESALVNLGIKSLFRRRRPPIAHTGPVRIRQPRTSSFPSGHATSGFTAAAMLGDRDRLRPLYYAVAVVVAASRVYVKAHHASDVVVGAALGAVMGRVGRRLFPLTPGRPEQSAPV